MTECMLTRFANLSQGMEELIKQAFLHVEVIGPHVQQGHYDLVGPNGEIYLPSVWEKIIEPGDRITMHMWPVNKNASRHLPTKDVRRSAQKSLRTANDPRLSTVPDVKGTGRSGTTSSRASNI